MMPRFTPLFFLLAGWMLAAPLYGQKTWKSMYHDPSVNFYDVCATAEKYFETHDKEEKGSGWKGYQRWRAANEYKYYPSGDRSQVDPLFPERAYEEFLAANPPANGSAKLFAGGWEELGPYRIDNITGHYAAGLGRVEDIYIDPTNANRIYLGSRSGGFWKTTDGGTSWQGGSTDGLVATGVNAMAVSPTNPDSILINVQNSRNGYSHGLYRSVDGGNSWAASNFNPTNVGFGGLGSNFRVRRLAYHPTIPNLVFVGTNKGLYRSTDNLQTWVRVFTSGDFSQIDFHPTNPQVVYTYDRSSGADNFVYRSSDAGASFTLSNQIAGNNGSTGLLSISADCPDCVYFASTSGVWKSTDGGVNFTFLTNPNSSGLAFAVNDQDTSKMVYGYVDAFASTNSGQNFSQVTWWYLGNSNNGNGSLEDNFFNSSSYVHADLRIARCINGVFYLGTDGFVAKSTDNGTTWDYVSQGTSIRENYTLGTSQSNHYRTIIGSQDNGTSIRVEGDWLEFYGADGMEGLIHPLNEDWMLGSFQYGGRRRTLDGGFTQSSATPPNQSGSGIGDWVAPLAYDPNDHMTLYNFSDVLYVSTDFGDSWTYRGAPNGFNGPIKQAAIAENNSDIVVISRNSAIEKSTNGGLSFSNIRNNLPNLTINDIAFDPNDDDVMVVVYGSYQNDGQKVFQTTNGGSSWTNITGNLGNMPLRAVVIDHSDSSNIYLGAEIGVYVKSMAGSTWTLYNPGLPNMTVNELEINYGSNTLKAATWGRGLWEYGLKDRLDHPAILLTHINNAPTMNQPAQGVDQYVTSVISYAGNLSSVYVEWSANAPTFGNVLPMSNTVDSTWATSTHIPHYPVGTKMYFKVFAVGANNDTTETYKFMYEVQNFGYCNATGSSGTGSDYIDYMELNGFSNSSGQDYYGNFTNYYIDLYADSTYTLRVDLNFAFAPDTALAWIDYDRDGDFESSEAIVLGSIFNGAASATGTFTVPSTANLGDTVTLRVRNAYNQDPSPCGTMAGEVEDYSIVLRDDACVPVSGTQTTTSCGAYTWFADGNSYPNSGTYTAVVLTSDGCDSTITLNLTVNNVDASVNFLNGTLTANASGATYQWLDCGNGQAPIAGATAASFTPAVTGNYAVQVTQNGCTEISGCTQVTVVGLAEGLGETVRLYPNPNTGHFFVDLGAVQPNAALRITDARGRVVREQRTENQRTMEVDMEVPAGTYFVEITLGDQRGAVPVVIRE